MNALGGQNGEFLILKLGYIHYTLGVKEIKIRESPPIFFLLKNSFFFGAG